MIRTSAFSARTEFSVTTAYAAPFHKLYVSDERGKAEAIVDVTKDEIVKTLHFNSETGMPQYDPVARKVYVNLQGENIFAVIDPATDEVIGRYPVGCSKGNHRLTRDVYLKQIQPALASVAKSQIRSNLGVSEPYSSDIQAGRRIPHPRHWLALAELAGRWERDCGAGPSLVYSPSRALKHPQPRLAVKKWRSTILLTVTSALLAVTARWWVPKLLPLLGIVFKNKGTVGTFKNFVQTIAGFMALALRFDAEQAKTQAA